MTYEKNYDEHPRNKGFINIGEQQRGNREKAIQEGRIPERKYSFATQEEREAWEELEANVRPGVKSDIGIQLEADEAVNSQVGGDHYKKMGQYQPWIVASKWLNPDELKGFMKGTVIAYLAREDGKGGREDIKKAMHTIQLYLELSDV